MRRHSGSTRVGLAFDGLRLIAESRAEMSLASHDTLQVGQLLVVRSCRGSIKKTNAFVFEQFGPTPAFRFQAPRNP